MLAETLRFTDNPAIAGRCDRYMVVKVDLARVLASWHQSLMAHEWLNGHGHFREPDDLNMCDRDKVLKADKILNSGGELPRPVLGIGILDNVEIGSGRDVIYALVRAGHKTASVHIPRSNETEFNRFLG